MSGTDSEEEMELPVVRTKTVTMPTRQPPQMPSSGPPIPNRRPGTVTASVSMSSGTTRNVVKPSVVTSNTNNSGSNIINNSSNNSNTDTGVNNTNIVATPTKTPRVKTSKSSNPSSSSLSSTASDEMIEVLRKDNERLRGILTLLNSRLDLMEINQRRVGELWEEVQSIKEALNDTPGFKKVDKQSLFDKSSLIPLLQKSATSDASEILDLIENDKSVYHSGWMSKKGRKVRNWKRRFFVLKGSKLSYFAKENDKTPLGDINLETCMIDDLKEREESGRPCMALLVEGRKLLFCAESPEENKRWYLYLACKNAELSYLRKLKHTGQSADNTLLSFLEQPRTTEARLDNNVLSIDSIVALTGPIRTHDILTSLSLRYARLNDLAVSTLCEAIKLSSSIERLDLEGNSISGDGAKSLASVLNTSKTLKILILKENKIGDSGLIHFSNAVRQGNIHLERLDLTHNGIGSRGACAMAEAFVNCTTIPEICLDDNSVGNEGAIALLELCQNNSNIATLRLQNNGINDSGIDLIASSLAQNTSLKRLYLAYNPFSVVSYKAMISTIMVNHSLQSVEFGDYRLETTDLCSLRLLHQCDLLHL